MKWTALLAVTAFLCLVGPATAAPNAIKGTVVAKHARSGTVVLAGRTGLGITVRVAPRRVRLGDRVSVVGTQLPDGTIRVSRLHVLSHVKTARIRGMVVKLVVRGLRVASGHSVFTIRTSHRRLSSEGNDMQGKIGEFEVGIENGELVEEGFKAAAPSGTVQIEGELVSVSPLVVSIEGLPIEITVPSGVTLPPTLAPGQEIELTVQTGAGNTFTLVSIDDQNQGDDDQGEDQGGSGGGDDGGGGDD
jgi:hypothetical protein